MKIKIEIVCDNDAFQGSPSKEIITILESIRFKLEHNGMAEMGHTPLYDSNGNRVGNFEIIED